MYFTTGFTEAQIRELCEMIWQERQASPSLRWPPKLGLFRAVAVTLTYLRRNRVQVDLAETFGVSQSTISRAITALTPALGDVLADWVPVAEDLDTTRQYIVDGTLLPCWSWKEHPELYSGKHHTTGKNVQVVCSHAGSILWISDPVDGARHDAYAIRASGVLDGFAAGGFIADKGYVGLGLVTPHKKPIDGQLSDEQRAHNRIVNQQRAIVERAIAQLKTWRIVHTDYRRPITTFDQTIATVVALHFYRTSL